MRPELKAAFEAQAIACRNLGSSFMGQLMDILPDVLFAAPRVMQRMNGWEGGLDASGASLPLRLAGGLHALVLQGKLPNLAPIYRGESSASLGAELTQALASWDDWLCLWLNNAPQTNEVARSAVLIAAASELTAQFNLPLTLSELGASAGLNLQFDAYQLQGTNWRIGPPSTVTLQPDWRGARPPLSGFRIADRAGVDLNPLDPEADGLRLLSYLWPDQPERRQRIEAALDIVRQSGARVTKGDAADWLETRLRKDTTGTCHMVFHTIAHQYFPETTKARIKALIDRKGACATEAAPLAWFGMEADETPGGAALTLRLWPGDRIVDLGRAGFHGQWVQWNGATL